MRKWECEQKKDKWNTYYKKTMWFGYQMEVPMTEREKMISGELYDPTDKELEQFLISPAWMYVKYI